MVRAGVQRSAHHLAGRPHRWRVLVAHCESTEPSSHVHRVGQQRRPDRAVRDRLGRRHRLALRESLPQDIRALTVTPHARHATTILLVAFLCAFPHSARADYIFTPFIGAKFAGNTAFLNLEQSAGSSKVIFGGSAGWLSNGILGAEGDFAYSPRFFEADNTTIIASTVATVSGSVMLATPKRISGYSLRPYLVGGLGLIHSGITYAAVFAPVDDNSLGMNLGAGAIGLLSARTGLRFELRHFRTFDREVNEASGETDAKLSFWRVTVGVLIRR